MGDQILRIEKLTNGYEVEIVDTKAMENNRKPKTEYIDPWKSYAFTTAEEVKAFIGEHLDSLSPPPEADEEYATAFKQAATED
jgi:hypothetical protein